MDKTYYEAHRERIIDASKKWYYDHHQEAKLKHQIYTKWYTHNCKTCSAKGCRRTTLKPEQKNWTQVADAWLCNKCAKAK